jgi:hypothetical protein
MDTRVLIAEAAAKHGWTRTDLSGADTYQRGGDRIFVQYARTGAVTYATINSAPVRAPGRRAQLMLAFAEPCGDPAWLAQNAYDLGRRWDDLRHRFGSDATVTRAARHDYNRAYEQLKAAEQERAA